MSQDAMDTPPAKPTSPPALRLVLLTLLALGAVSTAGLLMARLQTPERSGGGTPADQSPSKELVAAAAKYFPSWPAGKKPQLVIILTGEQHNYEQPCGCTEPQLGGLERRYNFIKFLRDEGLSVVPADLGDVYYNHYTPGRPTQAEQLKLKYKTSMTALSQMGYEAVCIGKEEFSMPLIEALSETVLNSKPSYRVLAANIKDRDLNFPALNGGSMIGEFKVTTTPVKVGIFGAIGPTVIGEVAKIDASIKFEANRPALIAMNAQQPDVRLLLFQGTHEEAKELAKEKPDTFEVILCLSAESEPPGEATVVGKTQIIRVGHKGRYVGAVAVFRDANGKLEYRYDLVPMSGDFKTKPEDKATSVGLKLLEDYTKEVKDKDLLSLYAQIAHPMQVMFPIPAARFQPHYVGSARCKECHAAEFQVWDTSKHAEAFETLVNNKKPPANRQFDGECVVCHTVGFGYFTGYRDEKRTPHLKGVGCENCHGPGSLHIDEPKNKTYQLALSPWKRKADDAITDEVTAKIIFKTCFQCHDTDNDHSFDLQKNWPKIGHGKNANAFKGAGAAAKPD